MEKKRLGKRCSPLAGKHKRHNNKTTPGSSLNNKDVKIGFQTQSNMISVKQSRTCPREQTGSEEKFRKIITIEMLKPTTNREMWSTDLENIMKMDEN